MSDPTPSVQPAAAGVVRYAWNGRIERYLSPSGSGTELLPVVRASDYDALQAKVARLEADAARYRWLAEVTTFPDYGDNPHKQVGWRVVADGRPVRGQVFVGCGIYIGEPNDLWYSAEAYRQLESRLASLESQNAQRDREIVGALAHAHGGMAFARTACPSLVGDFDAIVAKLNAALKPAERT